jgi:hypothetical protein
MKTKMSFLYLLLAGITLIAIALFIDFNTKGKEMPFIAEVSQQKPDYREQIYILLSEAEKKSDQEDVSTNLDAAKDFAQSGGFTLESIGFTQERSEELRRKGYLAQTHHFLRQAKKRNGTVDYEIGQAAFFANKLGLDLSSLGYSNEKLMEMRKRGYHLEAINYLERAETLSEKQDVRKDIEQARFYAKLAGKNLLYYGWGDIKVRFYLAKGYLAEALRSNAQLRQSLEKGESSGQVLKHLDAIEANLKRAQE